MKIIIQLFAAARDAAGHSPVEVTLAQNATIAELRDRLVTEFPALEAMKSSLLFAVNHEFVGSDAVLSESDEIACFPPVSGG